MQEFELDYLVLPRAVANAVLRKEMKPLDLAVYAIIQNFSKSEKGCFVANDTFAEMCGTTPEKISHAVSRLKEMGFVCQTGFDGRRRYLRAAGVGVGGGEVALPISGKAALPKPGNQMSSKLSTALPDGTSGSEGTESSSFGIATEAAPATPFDITMATTLEKAVRKLPARQTGITGAKPSTWVEHFRLLRTKDKIQEQDIGRVMTWYAAHIGEEFVPMAFSGEAFRKKWESIERAAGRDKTVVAEITPEAATIAKRLGMLGWPKGSAKALPGAAQACLTAYTAWRARRKEFVARLERDDLAEDYTEEERQRLIKFGRHLATVLPAAGHFVEGWLREVNGQVAGWEAWSGDLTHHVFKPEAKRFHAMGRGWAEAYCGKAARWDRFIEIMNKEVAG